VESAAPADTDVVSATPPQRMDLRPPLLPAEARAREEPSGDWFGTPAPSYISTMAFVMYMYNVQFPAIKAVLCIEIN
jgi:hypothetical protein